MGRTAFHSACEYVSLEIVDMLLRNSAEINIDLNAKDFDGLTAYHIACQLGQVHIVQKMIETASTHNFDIIGRTKHGKTGLMLAEKCGRRRIVDLIKRKRPSTKIWYPGTISKSKKM